MESKEIYRTELGRIVLNDSLEVLRSLDDASVDLVVTSPPFDLTRKKEYGNRQGSDYLQWLLTYGSEVHRVLRDSGSFVLDLGGAWNRGVPTRNLYQFRLLIGLVDEVGFELAQDFYWWNPSRLPTPAEWVTVRRIRVKDAMNTIWWLSKSPYPKASNRRVLQPYSDSMLVLLENGYVAKPRPSGHNISKEFRKDNGGSIPPNLLVVANTDSGSNYMRYCKAHGIAPHPARFPQQIPDFFIRLLTDSGDIVVDPFAGSCATGAAAEELGRRWLCVDLHERYLLGAVGRFEPLVEEMSGPRVSASSARYAVQKLGGYSATAEEALSDALPNERGERRESSPK